MRPEPYVMTADDPLPPGLQLIADETQVRLAREAEEARKVRRPPPKRISPEERPFPLAYPPLKY
jgi:hypothetical protein